jgi:aspartate kinase
MQIEIHKFGGTSVSTIDKIKNIAKRTIAYQREHNVRVILVLSAMSDTTNKLQEMASSISDVTDLSIEDELLATGEIVSCSLMALALCSLGDKAEVVKADKVRIETNKWFGNACIDKVNPAYLNDLLKRNIIPVVTGFQGITCDNKITTLGRGGSDITAIVLAEVLLAKCYIYTDVDGVYNIDPSLDSNAVLLEKISAEKMFNMAKLGAKVLHHRAAEYICKSGIECWIKPAHKWDILGTEIVNRGLSLLVDHLIILKKDIVELDVECTGLSAIKNITDIIKNSSSSLEIVGGSNAPGVWRLLINKEELVWLMGILTDFNSKYVIKNTIVKLSVLAANDVKIRINKDYLLKQILKNIDIDESTISTSSDRVVFFIHSKCDKFMANLTNLRLLSALDNQAADAVFPESK